MNRSRNILIGTLLLLAACSGAKREQIVSPPTADNLAVNDQNASATNNDQGAKTSTNVDSLSCPTIDQCNEQCQDKEGKGVPSWCAKCGTIRQTSDGQWYCPDNFRALSPSAVDPYGLSGRTSAGGYTGFRYPNQFQAGGFRSNALNGFQSAFTRGGYGGYSNFCNQQIGTGCDGGANMTVFIPAQRATTCLDEVSKNVQAGNMEQARQVYSRMQPSEIAQLSPQAQMTWTQLGEGLGATLMGSLKGIVAGAGGYGAGIVGSVAGRLHGEANYFNALNKAQMISYARQLDMISMLPRGVSAQDVCSGAVQADPAYVQCICQPVCPNQ